MIRATIRWQGLIAPQRLAAGCAAKASRSGQGTPRSSAPPTRGSRSSPSIGSAHERAREIALRLGEREAREIDGLGERRRAASARLIDFVIGGGRLAGKARSADARPPICASRPPYSRKDSMALKGEIKSPITYSAASCQQRRELELGRGVGLLHGEQRLDEERVLRDREDMAPLGLAIPARRAGKPMRDVLDLDIERRRVEKIEPASGQHALPGARRRRGGGLGRRRAHADAARRTPAEFTLRLPSSTALSAAPWQERRIRHGGSNRPYGH